MRYLADKRNKIVHPSSARGDVNWSPEPIEVMSLDDFEKFRGKCTKLSTLLFRDFGCFTGMDEIMINTLKYTMGNAGDIIKHGLIAEFCQWWFKSPSKLIFADSFGGCPWGNYMYVKERMAKLEGTVLGDFYSKESENEGNGKYLKYFSSSHLVKKIAENSNKQKAIYVFDSDENAKSNFRHSVPHKSDLKVINLPGNDGYRIFEKQNELNFNLVLIDPYSGFLPMQYKSGNEFFREIREHVCQYEEVYVALFILDMAPNNVRRNFERQKKELFDGISVSLRCPKITSFMGRRMGESEFDSEIMLISKQFEKPSTAELKNRLRNFAKKATHALGGTKVEFWSNEENK